MPLPKDLPVVDHHCHLSYSGDGVEAAKRFRAAGGTHLFLATQQYEVLAPRTVEEYEVQFQRTDELGRRVEESTGLTVYRVLAPYPIDLLGLAGSLGVADAVRVHEGALDVAGRWVEEQRAVALGEVGRPHFPVEPALAEACEGVLQHALEVGRDADCPVVVHCEELDPDGYRGLATLAARASFPVSRMVKHYARSVVPPEFRSGVVPSFVANRALSAESLRDPGPWFWETDYLDDPQRPGAVLDLATVPRRATQLAIRDPTAVERLRIPFESSVRTVYGFTPEVPDGGFR